MLKKTAQKGAVKLKWEQGRGQGSDRIIIGRVVDTH